MATVFEGKFANKISTRKWISIVVVPALVPLIAVLLEQLSLPNFVDTIMFVLVILSILTMPILGFAVMGRFSGRIIQFAVNDNQLTVSMGKAKIRSFNLPVTCKVEEGTEVVGWKNIRVIKRMVIADNTSRLTIAEESHSKTVDKLKTKAKPSDLFAEKTGTVDKLEKALLEYLPNMSQN